MSAVNPINLMEEQINDIDEVGANERVFNECVEVDANYDWSTKYKPIKPRYSNKVKMGFDWNRHNQAHYTSDNLPPKTIQGYRFNIFYPYLVDKTKTHHMKILHLKLKIENGICLKNLDLKIYLIKEYLDFILNSKDLNIKDKKANIRENYIN